MTHEHFAYYNQAPLLRLVADIGDANLRLMSREQAVALLTEIRDKARANQPLNADGLDRETFIEERRSELLSLGESWDSDSARNEAKREWDAMPQVHIQGFRDMPPETQQALGKMMKTIYENAMKEGPCRKCLIEREMNLGASEPVKCLKPATHIWTPLEGAETPLCEMHAARLSKLPSIAETIKPIAP